MHAILSHFYTTAHLCREYYLKPHSAMNKLAVTMLSLLIELFMINLLSLSIDFSITIATT